MRILFMLLPLLSVILSVILTTYFIVKAEKRPILYSFLASQLMIFIWSLGQLGELIFLNSSLQWNFRLFEYFAVCNIGACWLLFCLHYTEHPFFTKTTHVIPLFIPAIVFFGTLLTNSMHHQFFTQSGNFGVLYWINSIFAYTACALGILVLIQYAKNQRGDLKKQSFLLVVSSVVPLLLNLLYQANALMNVKVLGFDFTPASFSISILILSVASFRYKFLNIVPIAYRKIVDNIQESVVVVNNVNRIVNVNDAFLSNFQDVSGIVKRYDGLDKLMELMKNKYHITFHDNHLQDAMKKWLVYETEGEVILYSPQQKHYQMSVKPLLSSNNTILGKVISMIDITEYKQLFAQLEQKNLELMEYAETVEELAVVKERNRIAKDLHDVLGHSLTILVKLMQVGKITLHKNPEQTLETLNEAIRISKESLTEVRRSVSGLVSEKLESGDLVSAIESLIHDLTPSGVQIKFIVQNFESIKLHNLRLTNTLYRFCQESLTNAIRHGKANSITLLLKHRTGRIKISIQDDGQGCKNIVKGFGLTAMENHIKKLNGKLRFSSNGERGFQIQMEVPATKTLSQKGIKYDQGINRRRSKNS